MFLNLVSDIALEWIHWLHRKQSSFLLFITEWISSRQKSCNWHMHSSLFFFFFGGGGWYVE